MGSGATGVSGRWSMLADLPKVTRWASYGEIADRSDMLTAMRSVFETPYNSLHPVLFMHVPKSSGISMTQAIVNALLPRATFYGLDHSIFGPFHRFATL